MDDSVFASAKYQPYKQPTAEEKKRVAFAKMQVAQTDIKEDTYVMARPIKREKINTGIHSGR